jgi:signal transduction histidine kinase
MTAVKKNPSSKDIKRQRSGGIVAVSQLSRQINASLDLQETLNAIVDTVAELVVCSLAEIDLWDEERQMLVLQAIQSSPERAYPVGKSFPPGKGYTGWVVQHRQPLLVPDIDARLDIRPDILPGELPFKAYVGLPLLAGDELIGALVLVHDKAGAFTEDDLQLLEALAGQAAIAIRNAYIYADLSRQHRKLSALYTVASVINQPLPLATMMDKTIAKVIEVVEADVGVIRLLDHKTGNLAIAAYRGVSWEDVRMLEQIGIGEGIGSHLYEYRDPLVIKSDLEQDSRLRGLSENAKALHTFVIVPMWVKDRPVGTLGVSMSRTLEFTPENLELLSALGAQIGVAVENERLHQEAILTERLAAVGRVATGIAHDLRSPLGGILRSAEFLARPEISLETRQKLSRAVVSLAQRLIGTSQGLLDYVKGEKIPLKLEIHDLTGFLDEVLTVLQIDFSDQGIEVIKDFRYQQNIVVDADRMAQVVYNIAANARDAMPQGGSFSVSTRKMGKYVEIKFSDTGAGVPEDLSNRIFEPFFSHGKTQGAGLGLAIARRIIEEHGGTIRLESEAGHGATFVIRLPA